ncbi:MAG: lipopolysaccharide biosynthesis protein [Treponema sp.]
METKLENQKNNEITDKNKSEDEISLLDLLSVILKYIKMEITIVVLAMIFAVVYSIVSLVLPPEKSYMPNNFTAQANMLINDSASTSGASLSSLLGSSGLGNLMGLGSSKGNSYSSLAVYLSKSNPFFDAIVENFQILQREEFEKTKFPVSSSRQWVERKLKTAIDEDSGVFTLSFTDIDPAFARDVVNFSVDWLSTRFDELGVDKNKIKKANLEKNIDSTFKEIQKLQEDAKNVGYSVANGTSFFDSVSLTIKKLEVELEAQQEVYKQLKAQYELLKVQMESESPVFQILERPEISDKKSGPSRGMFCIIVTFSAIFVSLFLAFFLNAIENIKKDPVAISKLKLGQKRK